MTYQSTEESISFDASAFEKKLQIHYRDLLKQFKKNCRKIVYFHAAFLGILSTEIFSFFYFPDSSFSLKTALFLAGGFLTVLSYFFLYFYFEGKKQDEMEKLVQSFVKKSRQSVGIPKGISEHHISIAHACIRLINYLQGYERIVYPIASFRYMQICVQAFSKFWHFFDVFTLKEHLILAAIEEHIFQIHVTPTNVEMHTSLASTYVLRSKLYIEYQKSYEESFFHPFYKTRSSLIVREFQQAIKNAIEEYLIIDHYTPDDPWVHMQLAKSYHELQLHDLEMREYETILRLSPNDQQILLKLGILYFQQGQTAKGLILYEKLKEANYEKAQELLSYYGSYEKTTVADSL